MLRAKFHSIEVGPDAPGGGRLLRSHLTITPLKRDGDDITSFFPYVCKVNVGNRMCGQRSANYQALVKHLGWNRRNKLFASVLILNNVCCVCLIVMRSRGVAVNHLRNAMGTKCCIAGRVVAKLVPGKVHQRYYLICSVEFSDWEHVRKQQHMRSHIPQDLCPKSFTDLLSAESSNAFANHSVGFSMAVAGRGSASDSGCVGARERRSAGMCSGLSSQAKWHERQCSCRRLGPQHEEEARGAYPNLGHPARSGQLDCGGHLVVSNRDHATPVQRTGWWYIEKKQSEGDEAQLSGFGFVPVIGERFLDGGVEMIQPVAGSSSEFGAMLPSVALGEEQVFPSAVAAAADVCSEFEQAADSCGEDVKISQVAHSSFAVDEARNLGEDVNCSVEIAALAAEEQQLLSSAASADSAKFISSISDCTVLPS